MRRGLPGAVLWVCALALGPSGARAGGPEAAPAAPEGPPATSFFRGTISDADSHTVLPDAYVTIQSPTLHQDLMAVTDAAGNYRVGTLPPGTYSVRVEKEGYQPYTRKDIAVVADAAVTVNVDLEAVGWQPPPAPPAARPPAVDLTSGATGGSVEADFVRSAAVLRTGERSASGRSLELLAATLPGARTDPLGLALSGGSALEKQVLLDGLSVTDPATGALLFPLSMELVESLDVLSGGYLPEHGRSAGGALLVSTRSGSNEWHGAVYGQWAPGGLEGARTQAVPRLSAWRLSEQLWNQGDGGAVLSGPLLKDRVWFFLGVQDALERRKLTRRVFQYQLVTDPGTGQLTYAVDPATGEEAAQEIDGSARSWFADGRQLQYVAKVTWLPDVNKTVSLALAGIPSSSGQVDGQGLGFDPYTGSVWGWEPATTQAMARVSNQDARALVLNGSSAFWDRQLTVEGALGWYHQKVAFGSETVGPPARLEYRQGALPGPHGLDDFTAVLGEELPIPGGGRVLRRPEPGAGRAPLPDAVVRRRRDWRDPHRPAGAGAGARGGDAPAQQPGAPRGQGGAEWEWLRLDRDSSFEGGTLLREGNPVATLDDFRAYGALDSGGNPVFQGSNQTITSSMGGGVFVQDAWHLLDLLQVNLGVRWDAQVLTAPDGATAFSYSSQFSPRAGVVYDVTGNGRSKLYGSYARYVQSVPLDLVADNFGGERYLLGRYRVGPECDVNDPAAWTDPTRCRSPANTIDFQQYGGTRPPVDASAQPTAVDEYLAGAEYEVIPDLLAGAVYTHRTLVQSLRAITTNEGSSVFIANPGYGMGSVVAPAARDYDAVTAWVDRTFTGQWMAQLSYTWSWPAGERGRRLRTIHLLVEPERAAAGRSHPRGEAVRGQGRSCWAERRG